MTLEEKERRTGVRIGDEIEITNMEGEWRYIGRTGVVEHIDDALQIHGTWGGCALCSEYGDSWKIIKRKGDK